MCIPRAARGEGAASLADSSWSIASESDESRLAEVHRAGVSAVCDEPIGIEEVRALISTIP